MRNTNRRLIELSIRLDAISEQSAREKSIHHGHISKLHIWWTPLGGGMAAGGGCGYSVASAAREVQ